ncbi:unnamed protein product [Musa hybrid cultivar]
MHATGEGSSEESNCKVALISVHRESNKLHNWLADNDRVFFSLGLYLSGWWTPLTSEQKSINHLSFPCLRRILATPQVNRERKLREKERRGRRKRITVSP